MNKINFRCIFFSLFLIIGLSVLPHNALSQINTCAQETKEQLEANKNKIAEEAAIAAINAVDKYNAAANEYINTCEPNINKGTPSVFDAQTQQSAISVIQDSRYKTSFTDTGLYENTGIAWSAVIPKNEECKQLKNKAAAAQTEFNKKKITAINALGFYRNDNSAKIECLCSDNAQQRQCVTYASEVREVENNGNDKCELFSVYLAELSNCTLCPIFQVILRTNSELATIAWNSLAEPLKTVVISFGGVFLALTTLKNIGSAAGAGIGAYLKSMFGIALKIAITYQLLSSSEYIYNLFINPVVKGGLDMGLALLGIGNPQVQSCIDTGGVSPVGDGGGELDASVTGSIYKTIECFGKSAALMPAVGRGLICNGWHDSGLPDFNMWLIGLLLYVFGMAIWLVISFYLIDCTVQLGIVCAILPVLIACWPFKITQSYAYKGVRLLMNVFFNFTMMGVILLFGIKLVGYAANGKSGGLEGYMKALNENNVKKLKELSSLDGIELLMLIACCIFAFKLIGCSNQIADKFAGGSGSNIGAMIGGAAASAATSAVKGGAKLAAKGTGAVAKDISDRTGLTDLGNKVANAGVNIYTGAASKVGKAVGLGRFQPKPDVDMPKGQGQGGQGQGGQGQGGQGQGGQGQGGQGQGVTKENTTVGAAVNRNEEGSVTLPNG